jgi:hypothetical protein
MFNRAAVSAEAVRLGQIGPWFGPDRLDSGNADVNMPIANGDRDRRQPHRWVARMAAGRKIEFIAVPWADDVALFAKAQPGTFLFRRDHFLDLVENLALADRAAGMRTDIFIGEHFVAGAKNPNLDVIEGEYPVVAVGNIGQLGY